MGQNTIVINGKHYDAKTGRLITTVSKAVKPAQNPTPHKKTGVVLDGFSRRPSKVPSANAVHAKAEKSKTLRRDAVKKPSQHKIHSTTSHHASPEQKPVIHQNHTPENHERAARAVKFSKHSLISRFGTMDAPATKQANHKVAHVPVAQAPAIINHHTAPVIDHPAFSNPFDTALQNADSHLQQKHSSKSSRRHRLATRLRISPKAVSFGSFVIAGLMLGGFFVYQNIPNLAMRVAAARSGVHAAFPGYKPAGFALNGPIKYSPGKISISYRSTTDERAFQVTQSSSEWNSEALLDNFVATDRRPYQTYQDKGKTIYIFDGSNATWVDDGVWYQVEGASSLNSDQLLRLANSL